MHRMDENKIPRPALMWYPEQGKRRRGRPRKSCSDTLTEDLHNISMIWDDFEMTGHSGAAVSSNVLLHVDGLKAKLKL